MKENPSKTHLSDKNLTKEDTLKYEDLDASYKKQAIKAKKQKRLQQKKDYQKIKIQKKEEKKKSQQEQLELKKNIQEQRDKKLWNKLTFASKLKPK